MIFDTKPDGIDVFTLALCAGTVLLTYLGVRRHRRRALQEAILRVIRD